MPAHLRAVDRVFDEEVYAQLHGALTVAEDGPLPAHLRRCGVFQLRRMLVKAGLSPRNLTAEDVRHAWQRLLTERRWGRKHTAHVRTYVARALRHLRPNGEELARALHPRARAVLPPSAPTHGAHACLPVAIRRQGPTSTEYGVFLRLAEAAAGQVRSVTRRNLHGLLSLYAAVIAASSAGHPPTHTLEERWAELAGLSAADWLGRYARVRASRPRIHTDLFLAHLRALRTLHSGILRGRGPPIPLSVAGRSGRRHQVEDHTQVEPHHHPAAAEAPGDGHHEQHHRLRVLVAEIRERVCAPNDPPLAFSCAEVRAILRHAAGPRERLVVMLFLTTGLRIGGLVRLQYTPADRDRLWTIEKNNRYREVTLSPACRRLLDDWVATQPSGAAAPDGPRPPSRYVFPSAGRPGHHASTGAVWRMCARIFRRAGLEGASHAHPHTFRHTVVQLLYLNGLSFDVIARWIGHANPCVTSGVYRRLRAMDVQALVHAHAPFVPASHGAAAARDDDGGPAAWRQLAAFLVDPYGTLPSDGQGHARELRGSVADAHQ